MPSILLRKKLTPIDLGGETSDELRAKAVGITSGYRGITIPDWFNLFLEYALCLARNGKPQDSYEICEAAENAKVFCNSKEDIFLLHVTWCSK
jgi:general transcription factor 3C polypeptide 3 (transcription factor C subunit 4)